MLRKPANTGFRNFASQTGYTSGLRNDPVCEFRKLEPQYIYIYQAFFLLRNVHLKDSQSPQSIKKIENRLKLYSTPQEDSNKQN